MTDANSTNSVTGPSSSNPGTVWSKFYNIINQGPYEYGGDAFMKAVRNGDRYMVASFIARNKFNPFFMCDLDDALLEAVAHGRKDIVRLLLDEGVTIDTLRACDSWDKKYDLSGPRRWWRREIPCECRCSGTGLQQASGAGDLSMVALLLEWGADPNYVPLPHVGRTALQAASGGGYASVVQCLIQAGADVNAPAVSYQGRTALQAASGGGHVSVVQCLIQAGAEVNAGIVPCRGRTALQAAAENGCSEVLTILLAAGADVNADAAYRDGRTALRAAAERGHKKAVVTLLASGADVNAMSRCYGQLPALEAAAESGHAEIVAVLLAAGADPKTASSDSTALQAAAEGGYTEIVTRLLTAGADVDGTAVGDFNSTPLLEAAKAGHAEVVSALLAAGALCPRSGNYHRTGALSAAAEGRHREIAPAGTLCPGGDYYHCTGALSAAAKGGHREIVAALLAAGADIESHSDDGNALQTAARGGYAEIVASLLTAGADINAEAGWHGNTALQAAAQGGYPEIVAGLLTAGADINARTRISGRTALQAAAEGGTAEIVVSLLKAGADINAEPTFHGNTALQVAAERGNTEIVAVLLAAGADINAGAGYQAGTALQVSAREGHNGIVTTLLAAGADINARGGDFGRTALQAAAREGHHGIVMSLLAAGADVNAKPVGIRGRTALQAAAEGGHEEIVASLLMAGADANAEPASQNGITALEAAVKGGHVGAVASLLSLGQLNKGPIRAPSASSNTHSCVQRPSALKDNLSALDPGGNCLIWSINQPEVLQFLLQAGINTDVLSADGSSLLHCAVKQQVTRSASLLLLSGVDASTCDQDNLTPFDLLQRTERHCQPQFLRIFLQLGCEIRGRPIHLYYKEYKKSMPGSFLTLTALPLPLKEQPHPAANSGRPQSGKSGKVAIQITFSDCLPVVGSRMDERRLYHSGKDIEVLVRKVRYIVTTPGENKGFAMLGDLQTEGKVSCIRYWGWHRQDTNGGQNGIDLPSHMKMDTTGIFGAILTCSISFDYLTRIAGRMLETEDVANAFRVSAHKSTVYWTMHKASPVSDEDAPPILKTIDFFSTLDIGWVPDDAVDFFNSYVLDLHKKWRVLLEEADIHLDNSRKILLTKQGKSTGFIEILLLDAQTWSDSQSLLQTQVRTARDILTDFHETKYLQDEIVDAPAALANLTGTIERMEQEVLKEINNLDNKTQKMIELEFNLVSIYESRTSKEMGMSMKRLSWITFVFLPLMFVASLFGMNINIISGGPKWTWVIILAVCLFTVVLVVWVLLKRFPIDEWIREDREKVKTAGLKGNTQSEWSRWGFWRNKKYQEDLESGESFQFTRPKRRWTMKLKDH